VLRCQNRAARAEPIRLNQFPGVRNLELPLFGYGQSAGAELLHALRRMHKQDILIACWRWLEEILGACNAFVEKLRAEQPVFRNRKPTLPDREVEGRGADQLERQHRNCLPLSRGIVLRIKSQIAPPRPVPSNLLPHSISPKAKSPKNGGRMPDRGNGTGI